MRFKLTKYVNCSEIFEFLHIFRLKYISLYISEVSKGFQFEISLNEYGSLFGFAIYGFGRAAMVKCGRKN